MGLSYIISCFILIILQKSTIALMGSENLLLRTIEQEVNNKICKITNNITVNTHETYNNYMDSLNLIQGSTKDFVVELLSKDSYSSFGGFMLEQLAFFLTLCIGGALIIKSLWCCNCCLFNDDKEIGDVAKLFFAFTLILHLGVIVGSSVGIVFSIPFETSADDSACSFKIIMDHILNGEKKEILPKWGGFVEIQKSIDLTKKALGKINSETDAFFNSIPNPSYFDDTWKLYDEEIDNIVKDYNNPTKHLIRSPIDNTKNISTIYAMNLINKMNEATILGKIFTLDTKCFNDHLSKINAFRDETKKLKSRYASLENFLETTSKELIKFQSITLQLNETLSKNVSNIHNNLMPTLKILTQLLFGLSIAISALIFIIAIIYNCGRVYLLKTIMHILWNVSLLLAICNVILGSFFGLFAMAFQETSSAMYSILTDTKISSEYYAKCLNNNGDFSGLILDLPTNDNNVLLIDSLYTFSNVIETEITFFKNDEYKSNQILSALLNIAQFKRNLHTTLDGKEYEKALNILNDTIKTCLVDSTTKFLFELYKINCLKGYDDPKDRPSSKALCYIINTHDFSIFSTCDKSPFEVGKKEEYIKKSIEDNENKLIDVSVSLEKLQNKYIDVAKNIDTIYNGLKEISSDLYNALYPIIGNDIDIGFKELFNCNAMKDDLILFDESMSSKLSPEMTSLAIAFIVTSLFSFLGIFAFIPVIYYYSQKGRAKEVNISERTEQEKEQNMVNQPQQMIVQVAPSKNIANSKSSRQNLERKVLKNNKLLIYK